MTDPLAQVVTLLNPTAAFSKLVTASGPWQVRRTKVQQPFYCAILQGSSRLAVTGHPPVILNAGDFVLIPTVYTSTMSSLSPTPPRI